MRVEVTADDIKVGKPINTSACAFALAFRRNVASEYDISVGLNYAYEIDPEERDDVARYALPPEATEFISRFDREEPVVPTSFILGPREVRDPKTREWGQ